jgi:CRISPR/Cas system CSM-associated protein Csm4 (group 5 of RAMP superfamily)
MTYNNKPKSKRLQELLDWYNLILTEMFEKANIFAANEIVEQGRIDGFTDREISDMLRDNADIIYKDRHVRVEFFDNEALEEVE